jgi:hypothetical protein
MYVELENGVERSSRAGLRAGMVCIFRYRSREGVRAEYRSLAGLRAGIVTDGEKGVCLDPGEMGAILEAGEARGPGPPGEGKNEQLASDSGGE